MSVNSQASRGSVDELSVHLPAWRATGLGVLRIVFGVIWAVDAYFKWSPDFHDNFDSYLSGALDGQPATVQAWLNFWINTVGVNVHAFGYMVAVAETLVAIGLLFGVFSNLTNIGGALLSLVIWSTAEGFGGPYRAGSTDVGAAIIYVLVFAGLFLAYAGMYAGLDRWLTPALGRFGFLASGPLPASFRTHPVRTVATAGQRADEAPAPAAQEHAA
jgi:uncharacterized membrane protein YphA (DoxX/SURF4 family)